MKIAYTALALATLLVPAATFADNFDRNHRRGLSVQEKFERDHPRRPRAYCHRHRHRLHGDDKRRHCHNWNRESWRTAHNGAAGGFFNPWRRYERRSHPRPRYERGHGIWRHDHPHRRYERRHGIWRHDYPRPRYERGRETWRRDQLRRRYEHRRENWRRPERRHEAWRRDRFDANNHRRGGRWEGRSSDRGSNRRGSTDRTNDRRSR